MNTLLKQAAAAACGLGLILGSSSMALAKSHGHGHDNDNRGNRSSAHSCINPAGNMRGWCKSQGNNVTFVTGTVTAVNGSTASVQLPNNGQIVTVRNPGNLFVGEQISLRGYYNSNGQFIVGGNNVYQPYQGPYSSSSVSGMIVAMSGSTLTIVSGLRLITINDASATINRSLAVGVNITAYGNWSGSTFVANSIQ